MGRAGATLSRSGLRLLPCWETRTCRSREVRNLHQRILLAAEMLTVAQLVWSVRSFTHPLVTKTFWCSLLKLQGKFFLVHCAQGVAPEHLIFCWRQRLHLCAHISLLHCGTEHTTLADIRIGCPLSDTMLLLARAFHAVLSLSDEFRIYFTLQRAYIHSSTHSQ